MVPVAGIEPACSSYPFFYLEGRGDIPAIVIRERLELSSYGVKAHCSPVELPDQATVFAWHVFALLPPQCVEIFRPLHVTAFLAAQVRLEAEVGVCCHRAAVPAFPGLSDLHYAVIIWLGGRLESRQGIRVLLVECHP